MNCEMFEDWMLEEIEGSLPAGQRAVLNAHLAACGSCARAAADHHALDALLTASLKPPQVPSSFAVSLPKRRSALRLPAWLDWLEPVAQFATIALLALALPRLWEVFRLTFPLH